MSYTKNETVTGSWGAITANEGFVMLQVRSEGAVLIHVGASTPDSNSELGFVMSDDGLSEWSITALETGDVIYAKSLTGDDVEIAVIESGTAPV